LPDERFEEHLRHPVGRGHAPHDGHAGAAGGAACGDLVAVRVAVAGDRVADAGFDASGCGATLAAGSAAVELVRGRPLLEAARVGTHDIAAALGGLSPGKLHAAELAADALHRALGAAARADARLSATPGRVLVAMSGGVDSAVAALLAARAGREVAAVTLELWRDPENDGERSCCSASAVRGARALAHRLGLPHLTLDLRDEFRAGVVEPWLAEHRAGRTPNPCVRCNGHVRLDAMLDLADRLGAESLATGHYARVTEDGLLRAAADPAKDQSYMLAALAPASVARMLFPLGDLHKPRVRALAAEAGLPVAAKPDSQDLCFLAGTGRAAFLARHGGLRDRPGDVVDRRGRRLGRHRGHHHYTVGQRRGLGLGGTEAPLYVLATDAPTNTVTVGPRAELATGTVTLEDVRLHRPQTTVDAVRLRYRSQPLRCTLEGDRLVLADPVDGAAPGQAAVLLAGDVVVGSATIA
jgi:tRNA-uridine 2-sulfurtransferase